MENSKIKQIQNILLANSTLSADEAQRFFKSQYTDQFIGVTVPTIRKIAKDHLNISFNDLGELIKSPTNEMRLLALIIMTYLYKKSAQKTREELYQFYLDNLDCVNNWNLVDASAHLIMGAHLINKDKDILFKLTKSNNLWHRRIAIVATLYFIRNGQLDETFKFAQILINDKEDLIHKATGWMLREAGKRNPQQLITFLNKNAAKMPRTMLRYSIEKFTPEMRKKYMAIS